jgi:hypothetical protein
MEAGDSNSFVGFKVELSLHFSVEAQIIYVILIKN